MGLVFPRGHRFTGVLTFAQIRRFSQEYMRDHIEREDFDRCGLDLVYLVDAMHLSIRHDLIDERGETYLSQWTEEAASMRCYWRQGLYLAGQQHTWRGFPATCRFGFMWKSCTGSLLTAEKVVDADGLYRVTCVPSGCRLSCGYMEILFADGITLDEAPGWSSWDEDNEEPDWGSVEDRLNRPISCC